MLLGQRVVKKCKALLESGWWSQRGAEACFLHHADSLCLLAGFPHHPWFASVSDQTDASHGVSPEIREREPVAHLCLPLCAEAGMGPGRSLPRGCLLAVGSTALLT